MNIYDEYFKNSPKDHVAEFERIREIVHKLVPNAEDAITYGVAGFKLDGHFFIGFGSSKKHVSLFPGSEPIATLKDKLKEYELSKGTIRYSTQNPLPQKLVEEIVRLRLQITQKK